jgi:hypothetical protein
VAADSTVLLTHARNIVFGVRVAESAAREAAEADPGSLDLAQLTSFVAMADSGNLGRASNALHVAQPALSRRIEKLERSIGARRPRLLILRASDRASHAGARCVRSSNRSVGMRNQTVLSSSCAVRVRSRAVRSSNRSVEPIGTTVRRSNGRVRVRSRVVRSSNRTADAIAAIVHGSNRTADAIAPIVRGSNRAADAIAAIVRGSNRAADAIAAMVVGATEASV